MQPIQEKMKLTIISFLIFLFLIHSPQPATCVPRRWHTLKHLQPNAAANMGPAASPQQQASISIAVPPESAQASVKGMFSKSFSNLFKGSLFSNALKIPNPSAVPTASAGATNPVLKQICDSTDYPDLCIKSISPLLSDSVDVMSVLQAAIKVCDEQIKVAMAIANKLADSPEISICKDQYNDALDNIQSGLDAIKAKDIGTFKTMLSAVIADSSTCDDSFDGAESPLVDVDGLLSNMASNCLAIADLLKW